MSDALTSGGMSPGLLKVAERARREPEGRFHSLAHLIDVPALERAYGRMRKDAAIGVDGVTKDQYGQDLERNLRDLHARLVSKRYRHQPIRRVHIPKDKGKSRPIGVSAFEDKLVQDALREVLEAIYEQDFLACSYGFRPGRSAHDALRALDRAVHRGEVSWILEADIASFFDSVDRKTLMKMLQARVADGSLLRLVGKWCKTRSARLRRSIQAVADWCRRYRHLPVKVQHAALVRRIRGHFNYFGVSGNFRSLLLFVEEARQAWLKWLRRRSHRTRLWGDRVKLLFERYSLPRPRITVPIWGS